MIELDALYIVRYGEKYKNVIEEFDLDSKSKYINEIRERLEKSKYKEGFDFNTGYIVLNEDKLKNKKQILNKKLEEYCKDNNLIQKIGVLLPKTYTFHRNIRGVSIIFRVDQPNFQRNLAI